MFKYSKEQQEILLKAISALSQYEKDEISLIEFRNRIDELSIKENKDSRYQERYLQSPTSLIKSLLFWETIDSSNFKLRQYEYQKRLSELNMDINPSIKHKASFILENFSKPHFEYEKQRYLADWLINNKDSLNIFEISSLYSFALSDIKRCFSNISISKDSEASKIISTLDTIIGMLKNKLIFVELFVAVRFKVFSYFYNHPVNLTGEDMMILLKYHEAVENLKYLDKLPMEKKQNIIDGSDLDMRSRSSLVFYLRVLYESLLIGLNSLFVLEQWDKRPTKLIGDLDVTMATYDEFIAYFKDKRRKHVFSKFNFSKDIDDTIEKFTSVEVVE